MADKTGSSQFFLKVFFAFIAAVFIIFILKELRQIFIPFFIATILYFMLNKTVRLMLQRRIPKTIVLLGLLIIIFISLYLFGLLIFTGVSSFIDNFPAYNEKITLLLKNMLISLKLPIIDVQKYIAGINWEKTFNSSEIIAVVSDTVGNFTQFVGNLALVLLLLMFMLGEKVPMILRISRTLSRERADDLIQVMEAIDAKVQHYLFIKTMMSIATAFLAGLIMLAGRVDFVIFSALLIFFLNYIPTFGSLIGTIFPVLITFLKYGFCLRLLLVTLGLMAMQFVMGNVLEPHVMGKSLDLSPIVILLALIFWGWLWGIIGMFLAVPITAALKIIFEQIPGMKPLAAAMSGE
jgi:predicted PurR-regulated permease PerM